MRSGQRIADLQWGVRACSIHVPGQAVQGKAGAGLVDRLKQNGRMKRRIETEERTGRHGRLLKRRVSEVSDRHPRSSIADRLHRLTPHIRNPWMFATLEGPESWRGSRHMQSAERAAGQKEDHAARMRGGLARGGASRTE